MAAPTFVNRGAYVASTNAMGVPSPASISADDILLLWVCTTNGAASITNSNGGTWAATADSPQSEASNIRLACSWSRYNGTQGDPTVGDSGDLQHGVITAWRGCITSGNPWDVTSGGTDANVNTSVTVPGDTTTVADCRVVIGIAIGDDGPTIGNFTNSDLGSIANTDENGSSTGSDSRLGFAHGTKAAAGSYGNSTATLSANETKAYITIALKPPTSSSFSIDAGAGSYSISGTAAGLEYDRIFNADAGSYSISGTDTSLTYGRAVIADAGSYAVSGTDASLEYDRIFNADSGSYTLTATDASLEADRVLSADAGSYVINGSDVELSWSGEGAVPTHWSLIAAAMF